MRKAYTAMLALAVGGCLTACSAKAPTGQVVAKVGKDEITAQELTAELGNFNPPDAKTRKLAEQRALQNIVQRKLIAQAATAAGIAKTPEFAIQKTRVEDSLLVETWQKSLVAAVPDPAPEQVKDFIAKHPELFASRKIYAVDQVRMPMNNDPSFAAALKPLNTLEDIVGYLSSRGIRYEVGKGSLDSLSLGPDAAVQIQKLPPTEVIVIPMGNALVANKITDVKVSPVPDQAASKLAAQYLRTSQAREAVQRMFGSAVSNHPKVKVVYNKAYEPAPSANDAKNPPAAKAG